MKNLENCPEDLLDLLSTHAFDELSEADQNRVMIYLSEQDYTAYHESMKSLRLPLEFTPPAEIPTVFHEAFQDQKKTNYTLHIQAWQLAAALILIGFLWIWSLQLQATKEPLSQLQKDTIYLTQAPETESIKVYDTIFIQQYIQPNKQANKQLIDTSINKKNNSVESYQLEQLNAIRNKRKNKSIKEDSLFKNFEFVRI